MRVRSRPELVGESGGGRGGGDGRDVRIAYRQGRFQGRIRPGEAAGAHLSSPAVAANVTAATRALDQAGVGYQTHPYTIDGAGTAPSYGESVAATLGVEPRRVFKTLVAMVDGAPVVAIVPVDRQLHLKALAHAVGGKRADMAVPGDAERLTGYVVGGISPFGQRRKLPVVLDSTARDYQSVYVSGGRRGLQIEVSPAVLTTLLTASLAPIRR
jgi:Cys-tRNA(Pro)/Cys-tRNA(Cys) deacylase